MQYLLGGNKKKGFNGTRKRARSAILTRSNISREYTDIKHTYNYYNSNISREDSNIKTYNYWNGKRFLLDKPIIPRQNDLLKNKTLR